MEQKEAGEIVNNYINRIYSFVKKRVSNEADVQDISQEIAFKLYKSLCIKDVINVDGFVWTVARNTLVNFYRENGRFKMNVSIDDNEVKTSDGGKDIIDSMIEKENYHRIRKEIAYLSKIQRQILIMYYYEEKKQKEIASILNLPVGTVKWHLSVAKNELKRGMAKMRNINDLKFSPIKFAKVRYDGYTGTMGNPIKYVRSALSQNILYTIKDSARTIEEIADIMNVSPVYVESEIEFLEEHQLVIRDKNKYICNIIIEETNGENEVNIIKKCYRKIAEELSAKLFDEIVNNNYLNSPDILGPKDDNFRMWGLLIYLIATANVDSIKKTITFEQAATIRPDGGCNIITASVDSESEKEILNITEEFCGPCWNEDELLKLWLVDSKWSDKRVTEYYGGPNIQRDLKLIGRFISGDILSVDEYTYLLEKGYIIKQDGVYELGVVAIKSGEIREKLEKMAYNIKNEVIEKNLNLIREYQALLEPDNMPKNVKIQREYINQYLFSSDAFFCVFSMEYLIESGRLKIVEDKYKKAVGQIVILK